MLTPSRCIRICSLMIGLAALAGCAEEGSLLGPEASPSSALARGGNVLRRPRISRGADRFPDHSGGHRCHGGPPPGVDTARPGKAGSEVLQGTSPVRMRHRRLVGLRRPPRRAARGRVRAPFGVAAGFRRAIVLPERLRVAQRGSGPLQAWLTAFGGGRDRPRVDGDHPVRRGARKQDAASRGDDQIRCTGGAHRLRGAPGAGTVAGLESGRHSRNPRVQRSRLDAAGWFDSH